MNFKLGLILRLSHNHILEISEITLSTAKKHLQKLGTFGINSDFLENFENDIKKAEDLLNKNSDVEEQKNLTSKKNKALENCYDWARQLAIRIEICFGRKSEVFENFPSKKLLKAQRNEAVMLPLMETVIKIAENNFEDLQNCGLTKETIEQGRAEAQNLRTANKLQKQKKAENKLLTKERTHIFEQLYETVNRINKVGRMVYKTKKYERELFASPWKKPRQKQVETFEGLIDPNSETMITGDISANNLTFKNLGNTDLQIFRANNTTEKTNLESGYILKKEEIKKLKTSILGSGDMLIVKNLSQNKIGAYRVEI